ncbi:MAG: tRNA (N(6)-L-threonylcarbamoyladenosine(37)-C(2))-methylthiotransferase MtaB [Spirochaetes bacterium]|nr:tRNA (N(6)-L-threonylcarbamoyladenosine(37)-C(2))-methylthiotransferase MtaB [Spirochaetota bacterium]
MRVGFHTFGCKLNQYETEALASPLRSQGFTVVSARQEAEVYIVNTCTVTSRADHKARAFIRGLARAHPQSLLVVTGCSAQLEAESLGSLAGNVVVVGQSEKAVLLDLPRFLEQTRGARGRPSGGVTDPFALHASEPTFHTRAFLKIQDGCDSRCAYCRVPLARGPSVSLALDEAVRRACELEQRGCREIVLTGVNISAWHSAGQGLDGLLLSLPAATRQPRLRLSSLEPEALSQDLAAVLAEPRICPHFHLSVQSGSDAVLSRMKRRYRAEKVREGAALLRAAKGAPFLAADILVGFPGETEEDHAATRRLIEDVRFSALHVFPFSPRPGTAAAQFKPRVPERIRDARARPRTT